MKNESKGKGKEALSGPRTRHTGVPGTPAYPARRRTWHAKKKERGGKGKRKQSKGEGKENGKRKGKEKEKRKGIGKGKEKGKRKGKGKGKG